MLKLCPFCNSRNYAVIVNEVNPGWFEGYVVCVNCGTLGPDSGERDSPERAEEFAKECWNQRYEVERAEVTE